MNISITKEARPTISHKIGERNMIVLVARYGLEGSLSWTPRMITMQCKAPNYVQFFKKFNSFVEVFDTF